MKRIKSLIFDVDGTLSSPGQPIDSEMSRRLIKCLDYIDICILTAQKLDQTKRQILNVLYGVTEDQLTHLHLFNTQGTQAYYYNPAVHSWMKLYSYAINHDDVQNIYSALEKAAKDCDLWKPDELEEDSEYFDNRETQITFAGLGSKADPCKKAEWDPNGEKRRRIIEAALKYAPQYEYHIGGSTSIDVTIPGMNKAFGLDRILEYLSLSIEDVVYIGDDVGPGGNDYPVVFNGDVSLRPVTELNNTLYYLMGFYDARKGIKRLTLRPKENLTEKKE